MVGRGVRDKVRQGIVGWGVMFDGETPGMKGNFDSKIGRPGKLMGKKTAEFTLHKWG